MAIDYAKALGQVRLLISDVDEERLVLSDDMVTGFLARYGAAADGPVAPRGPINRAAADALDTIASSEALVLKVIRTGDGLTTDGAKTAEALRNHAKSLRDAADKADEEDDLDDGGYFGVAEFSPYGSSPYEAAEQGV